MSMQMLRTASLTEIRDGMLAAKIDGELVKIHADCMDRPALKKPRVLTLKIIITPVGDDPLEGVDTDFNVNTTLPGTSFVRRMKSLAKRNGFVFDSDTDSIDHDPLQQRLGGIDSDED